MIRKSLLVTLLAVIPFVIAVAEEEVKFPKIDRKPKPASWKKGEIKSIAKYDPNSRNPFQVDLRAGDVSKLDLRDSLEDLQYADFDDRTVWPNANRMPKGFDIKRIMELGKNPGLGVRQLHKQGVTGKGVGVAILDQALLVDHKEYADRLRFYEEINIQRKSQAQMHGPAVASIAVGKTVGVAPEADLYYIAEQHGNRKNNEFEWDFTYLAQAIERILEINEQLAADKKIRVISISVGWNPKRKGYQEVSLAAQKARDAGMLVVCSSVEQVHGFKFHGLGRKSLADPDVFESYEPGLFWKKSYYSGIRTIGAKYLLIPMDSRTTASPSGSDEYVFYRSGGWSWSIPYIAGVYALASQVEPTVTPDRFWVLAMKTGRTIELEHGAEKKKFGVIIDPAKLIESLKAGKLADSKELEAALKEYKSESIDQTDIEFGRELNARIAKIDINKATREDIIKIFGKPLAYLWGSDFFTEDQLPDRYIMQYPTRFSFFIANGGIVEIRFHEPGYKFRDALEVGATVEETFEILGPPLETVQGRPDKFKEGVLYIDIDGRKGYSYYQNAKQKVRLFFADDEVRALFLTRGSKR